MRLRSIVASALTIAAMPALAAPDHHADRNFVDRAANANLLAVAESRLAAERDTAPAIKDLARRLAGEHQAAEASLGPAADAAGTPVPAGMDAEGQGRLARLQAMQGLSFARAYVADQLALHSNALTLYGDELLLGSNAGLKALAIRLIPVTEAQLKATQALNAP